jgi:hypothetical protein
VPQHRSESGDGARKNANGDRRDVRALARVAGEAEVQQVRGTGGVGPIGVERVATFGRERLAALAGRGAAKMGVTC